MSAQLNHTTVIDFSATLSDIKNLRLLPDVVQAVIRRANRIDRCGFQELIGRIDRQFLWAAGGRYDRRGDKRGAAPKFFIQSIGWKDETGHWAWSEGKEVYQVAPPVTEQTPTTEVTP